FSKLPSISVSQPEHSTAATDGIFDFSPPPPLLLHLLRRMVKLQTTTIMLSIPIPPPFPSHLSQRAYTTTSLPSWLTPAAPPSPRPPPPILALIMSTRSRAPSAALPLI